MASLLSLSLTFTTPLSYTRIPTAAHNNPPRISPIHTTTDVSFTTAAARLTTPAWRFILLSDGHIHNLLSHLVEYPLSLSLESTELLQSAPALQVPPCERLPAGPCVRRVVTLNDDNGIPLLYASSIWTCRMYDAIMRNQENRSLYHVFGDLRLAISRKILAVHFGTCDQLCPTFGVLKGSHMWARDYVFRQRGEPFVIVHEVLSPSLQKYLGDIVPPEQVRD